MTSHLARVSPRMKVGADHRFSGAAHGFRFEGAFVTNFQARASFAHRECSLSARSNELVHKGEDGLIF